MKELPQGQVRPEAQPLSSFLQPAQRQVAAPAGPMEIPRAPGVGVIQQGSGGNVQGFNRFAQTAAALAPFNQQLTQLVGTGMTMYAQGQVQEGINEALRAKALLDAQVEQSGAEYAAENRSLSVVDPIAALMMDQVNPFRRAGRQRALVNLASAEAKGAMVTAYRNMEGGYLLEPGDPRLAQLKADATRGLVEKYGLDESSPGFAQKFLPQLNEGSDRVTEMQWQDRQNYLKDTVWRTAQSQLLGVYHSAVRDGLNFNGEIITADQGPRFRTAVVAAWTLTLDGLANELGIAGEVTPMKVKAIEGALALAESSGNLELRDLLRQISVGPPDKFGYRAPAQFFMTTEILESEMKFGEMRYKREQREQESLGRDYQEALFDATYGVPDGPERLAAIEQLREDPRFASLPRSQQLELEQEISTNIDQVTARGRSVEPVAALLQDMDGRVGTQWNTGQADAEFEAAVQGAPEDKKDELRRQYAAIRRRNNDREASPTSREANGVIDRKIKANLLATYPRTVTEAALRGGSIEQVMAGLTDGNAAASAQRQYSAFQAHVRSRIAEAEGKKGAPLTAAETVAVATQAVDEYGRSDPKQRAFLFPGVDGQPGVGGDQAQQAQPQGGGGAPAAPRLPPGARPASRPVYPTGQLDNIPDRQSRLRSWQAEPVLNAQAVITESNRILYEGGRPSAALQRFARDAGTTPGALLNRQIDFYPGIQVTPEERQRLQRDGRRAQATRNAAAAAAPARSPQDSPVARASGWMMDMLMGVRPATAAQRAPARSAVGVGGGGGGGGRGGQGGQIAMRTSGGGATPLTRLIGSHESYGGNYGAFNRGGSNKGHTAHGSGIDPKLTGMTIGEIQRRQLAPGVPKNQHLHAVGKYQIIGSTLKGLIDRGLASPSERFTPAVQDRLFVALARGRIVRGNVEATMRGLQQEWIGLQYADKAKLKQATIDLMRNAGMF
jgi:hypothetical protein